MILFKRLRVTLVTTIASMDWVKISKTWPCWINSSTSSLRELLSELKTDNKWESTLINSSVFLLQPPLWHQENSCWTMRHFTFNQCHNMAIFQTYIEKMSVKKVIDESIQASVKTVEARRVTTGMNGMNTCNSDTLRSFIIIREVLILKLPIFITR